MAMPQVSWYLVTPKAGFDYKTEVLSIAKVLSMAATASWPVVNPEADGTDQAVTHFAIWNNKGTVALPTTDVSDMQDCKFTVVDGDHGNTGAMNCTELLGGGISNTKWCSARCNSAGTLTFSNIGSLAPATIDSGAIAIKASGTSAGVISGVGNDGDFTLEGTAGNFSLITVKMNIPALASSGPVAGFLRVSFKYI